MSAAKPYNQFRALRPEYLALCDGNPCAALIVDLFAYWTQVRRSNDEQARGGGEDGNDLWFYRTLPDIGSDLYDAFGRSAVRSALKLLSERGLIETRTNPDDPRDRTTQYRLTGRWHGAEQSTETAREPKAATHPATDAPRTVQDAISHDGEGAKSNALARASDPPLRDLPQETHKVVVNTDVARERRRTPPQVPAVVAEGWGRKYDVACGLAT